MTQTQEKETWSVAAREMRTRDADAEIYEDFFTDFQTRVEHNAYAAALAGGPPVRRSLEVACGTGRTLDLLSGRTLVGIDFSLSSLVVARKRFGARAALIQASATHLPFKDGVFDETLCAGLLLHMPTEEVRIDVLCEMGRVSARPGRIAIATHSWSMAVRRMFEQDREEHNFSWHRTTPLELERLIKTSLSRSRYKTWGICHLPRWKVGNKLGSFGVWLDGALSRLPGIKHLTGTIVVAKVELLP